MRQVINFIYLKRRYADALISNGAGDVPTQVYLADDSVCAYRSVDRVLGPSTDLQYTSYCTKRHDRQRDCRW